MSRGKLGDEAREQFSQLVLQHKDELFGSFTTKITAETKKKCWEQIRNELVSAGAVQYADKSAEQMRALYTDMKRRTMDKLHKSRTTGAGKVVFKKVWKQNIENFLIIILI